MTSTEAKKLVVMASAGTAALSAIKAAKSGSVPARRMVIGALIVAVALAGLAEYQPSMAGAFATLMLVTALFVLGGDAVAGISQITRATPTEGTNP